MKTSATIIKWLLSYVKPLRGKMTLAILLGTLSYLAVIAIPVVGTFLLLSLLQNRTTSIAPFVIGMITCGLLRGILRYGEQYLNHDIAFSLLAMVRDHVFGHLRKLAPAKLQGKKSGDLIALITSDVEALEVFFAHTVSPVCIAVLTSGLVVLYLGLFHWILACIALIAFALIGVLIPVVQFQQSRTAGDTYKKEVANLNQAVVEQVNAVFEIRNYQLAEEMEKELDHAGKQVNRQQKIMLLQSIRIQNLAEICILFFPCLFYSQVTYWD